MNEELLFNLPNIKLQSNRAHTPYGESSQSHYLRYSLCNINENGVAIELVKPILCRDILAQYVYDTILFKKIKEITCPTFGLDLPLRYGLFRIVEPLDFYNSEELVMSLTFKGIMEGANNLKNFFTNLYLLHSLEKTLKIKPTEIFSVTELGSNDLYSNKLLIKADPKWISSHVAHSMYSYILRSLLVDIDKEWHIPTHIVDHLLYCKYTYYVGQNNTTGAVASYIFDLPLKENGMYVDFPNNIYTPEAYGIRYLFNNLFNIVKSNPLTFCNDIKYLTDIDNFQIVSNNNSIYDCFNLDRSIAYNYGALYLIYWGFTKYKDIPKNIYKIVSKIYRIYNKGYTLGIFNDVKKLIEEESVKKRRTSVRKKKSD